MNISHHLHSSISRSIGGEGGVGQMITLDHRGEGGGVKKGPKYDPEILEQPLIYWPLNCLPNSCRLLHFEELNQQVMNDCMCLLNSRSIKYNVELKKTISMRSCFSDNFSFLAKNILFIYGCFPVFQIIYSFGQHIESFLPRNWIDILYSLATHFYVIFWKVILLKTLN